MQNKEQLRTFIAQLYLECLLNNRGRTVGTNTNTNSNSNSNAHTGQSDGGGKETIEETTFDEIFNQTANSNWTIEISGGGGGGGGTTIPRSAQNEGDLMLAELPAEKRQELLLIDSVFGSVNSAFEHALRGESAVTTTTATATISSTSTTAATASLATTTTANALLTATHTAAATGIRIVATTTPATTTLKPMGGVGGGVGVGGGGSVYCPLRFDGYLCWPRTPAGTVLTQMCPDFVEGFSSKFLAHKTCLDNGSWFQHPESGKEWSNYTNCVDYDDFGFRTFINELYVKGYGISLIALLCSLAIFLGFKSLRCTRIRIHVHLFASLAFTCFGWIVWYKFVVEQPALIRGNPLWCIGLHLLVHYFMLVNYFWMFCEGMHLHLVLVVVFVKDTVVMRWFMFIAWCMPIIFLTPYAVARHFHIEDNIHCWMEDSALLWILSVPICVSLVASFVFLINVLRVIVRKLHPQSAQPAPLAIRKAVRATIILVPLFGLQHFLLPYRPDSGTQLERAYQMLSVILVSLQGCVVSFLFCFANQDVIYAVRSLLNSWLPSLVSPPPPSTNTGQLATTTPSRELGV